MCKYLSGEICIEIDKPAVSFYHFIMCLTFMTAFLAGILNKKGLCKL